MCKSYDANGSHSQRVPKGWDATALRWVMLKNNKGQGTHSKPDGIGKHAVPSLCSKRSTRAMSLGHAAKKSMQLGWDSPLLWSGHTGGVGLFLPRAIWKSWANKETGPGQETQQLHSADKCPETIKHKSMEKMGSLVLSTPFFMRRDLRCQSQRDQTSADNPVIFKFIFGCGNVICG